MKKLKKLAERHDWSTWEVTSFLYQDFGILYSFSHMARLLKTKFKAYHAKPYPKDYRRNPYYRNSFRLKLTHIFKRYKLKYDEKTDNIIDLNSNKPFLIFSFDESSFQLFKNNLKLWSLIKPMLEYDSTLFKCKAAGFYSLTPEGNDLLRFMENLKTESIIECLEEIREHNPEGIILLLIDNFPSHKPYEVKDKAKELNIELCYLPTYSPQLQPEEKIWKSVKRLISLQKVTQMHNYNMMKKKEREEILYDLVKNIFYMAVLSKDKWNSVLNNFIKPIIKSIHPRINSNVEIQKV